VIIDEKVIRTLEKGDSFGDLALLYNAKRSASILALEECYFYGMNRCTF